MVDLTEHLKRIAKKGGKNGWKYMTPEGKATRVKKMQEGATRSRAEKKK